MAASDNQPVSAELLAAALGITPKADGGGVDISQRPISCGLLKEVLDATIYSGSYYEISEVWTKGAAGQKSVQLDYPDGYFEMIIVDTYTNDTWDKRNDRLVLNYTNGAKYIFDTGHDEAIVKVKSGTGTGMVVAIFEYDHLNPDDEDNNLNFVINKITGIKKVNNA